MNFTKEERIFLITNAWKVNSCVAYKNWSKIVKKAANHYEVQTLIDEPDGNNYWEFDREENELARAILHRTNL